MPSGQDGEDSIDVHRYMRAVKMPVGSKDYIYMRRSGTTAVAIGLCIRKGAWHVGRMSDGIAALSAYSSLAACLWPTIGGFARCGRRPGHGVKAFDHSPHDPLLAFVRRRDDKPIPLGQLAIARGLYFGHRGERNSPACMWIHVALLRVDAPLVYRCGRRS